MSPTFPLSGVFFRSSEREEIHLSLSLSFFSLCPFCSFFSVTFFSCLCWYLRLLFGSLLLSRFCCWEKRGRREKREGGGLTTKNVCHRIHHLVANHQTSEDLAVLENVYISEFGGLAVNRMHNFSINEYAIGKGEKGVWKMEDVHLFSYVVDPSWKRDFTVSMWKNLLAKPTVRNHFWACNRFASNPT